METHPYIEINPQIMMGKPVIKGTRITVEMILESLSAGESVANLLTSYPRLTNDAVLAALSFVKQSRSTLNNCRMHLL